LDNFEARSGRDGLNWDQDRYYVWVRNCFRELGLDAAYTGSAGKLKRADVTVRSPFLAGVEVKSPAEGEITVKAIRQAVDAAREVAEAFGKGGKSYPAVVGPEIARGAHSRALSWARNYGIKVPLIRGRYLLYILLKHKTYLPQDPADVERLFKDYNGWFGHDELERYLRDYFTVRREQIRNGNVSVSLASTVQSVLGRDPDKAVVLLDRVQEETVAELTQCFPDPHRTARGGYAAK